MFFSNKILSSGYSIEKIDSLMCKSKKKFTLEIEHNCLSSRKILSACVINDYERDILDLRSVTFAKMKAIHAPFTSVNCLRTLNCIMKNGIFIICAT